jgi:hypothetical protein
MEVCMAKNFGWYTVAREGDWDDTVEVHCPNCDKLRGEIPRREYDARVAANDLGALCGIDISKEWRCG